MLNVEGISNLYDVSANHINLAGTIYGHDANLNDVSANHINLTGTIHGHDANLNDVSVNDMNLAGTIYGHDAILNDVSVNDMNLTGTIHGHDANLNDVSVNDMNLTGTIHGHDAILNDVSVNDLDVNGDVSITGNITVNGSFSFSEMIQNTTTINNTLLVSTQLDISNQGTGPALKVSQYGIGDDQDVAMFNAGNEGDAMKIDSSGNTFVYKDMELSGHISLKDVSCNGRLVVDDTVGIGINNPERLFHVRGDNAIWRLDRDRPSPALQIHRYDTNFVGDPLKGFAIGMDANGPNDGFFYINDYGRDVGGGATRRFTIENDGAVIINHSLTTDVGNFSTVNSSNIESNTANITTLTNSKITSTDRIIINNTSPTLYLKDTNGRSGMIHMNSDRMYFLSGGDNTESWSQVGGEWPLILYTTSNTAEFGGPIRSKKGRSRIGTTTFGNENALDIDPRSMGINDALGLRASGDSFNIVNFYNTGGGNRGSIKGVNSGSIQYNTTSDRRKKEDIIDLENGLEKVMKLKPRTYRWKEGHELDDGFIAQEVFETLPHLIPSNRFKCDISQNDVYHGKLCSCCNIDVKANGEDYIFGIDYGKFTPYLCKAIQEQQQQIETLQKQYDELLTRIQGLEL